MADLRLGDCVEVMEGMTEASVDSIVCDPPYGLEFMGKAWDKLDWRDGGGMSKCGLGDRQTEWVNYGGETANATCAACGGRMRGAKKCSCDSPDWRVRGERYATRTAQRAAAMQESHAMWATAALRILRPSSYLLAFGGTRTWHRLACALEDAGFEIRDTLMWMYGCLSDDTEVLIDGEWEPYHKATAGRHALCYNQKDETYSWQPINELLVYAYDDTAYRLCSDHTDQLVTRNHRCLIERGGSYVFEYAEEAARQREARVPVLEDVQGLLAALPVPQRHTGVAQDNVFTEVCCGNAEEAQDDGAAAGHGQDHLRGLRPEGMEAEGVGKACRHANLLMSLQRCLARAGVGEARAQGSGGVDGREQGQLPHEDERAEQPSMEGRRHHLSQARQLLGRAVRALSDGVHQYGAQGRLRDGAPAVCCAGVGATAPTVGSGASPRPRSDEQRAAESHAVRVEPRPQTVGASRFTSASLARLEPVHYTGTVWCLSVPTGAFVARRNGKVFVTGNSGFPKGKSCLKPAWEPVILARKPGKMRELGIDECRIPSADAVRVGNTERSNSTGYGAQTWQKSGTTPEAGRWPANVLLDEEAAEGEWTRYFYCAKASRRERNEGLDGIALRQRDTSRNDNQPSMNGGDGNQYNRGCKPVANSHPTVKPVAVMRWLVRLVARPGDTVLDPFMGSGTTGVACAKEDRWFIGIEREPSYMEIAKRRIMYAEQNGETDG